MSAPSNDPTAAHILQLRDFPVPLLESLVAVLDRRFPACAIRKPMDACAENAALGALYCQGQQSVLFEIRLALNRTKPGDIPDA